MVGDLGRPFVLGDVPGKVLGEVIGEVPGEVFKQFDYLGFVQLDPFVLEQALIRSTSFLLLCRFTPAWSIFVIVPFMAKYQN